MQHSIISALVGLVVSFNAFAGSTTDYKALNEQMLEFYAQAGEKRQRGDGYDSLPQEVKNALESLPAINITPIDNMLNLAKFDPVEVVVQEYLRQQTSWGMPWLLLSWSRVHTNVEQYFVGLSGILEEMIRKLRQPMSPEDTLVAYTLSATVLHNTAQDSANWVSVMREDARVLGEQMDRTGFYDIRVEIHQEPGLTTISRVQDYISKTTNAENKALAEKILGYLKLMFGQGSYTAFLENFDTSQTTKDAFTGADAMVAKLGTERLGAGSNLANAIAALDKLAAVGAEYETLLAKDDGDAGTEQNGQDSTEFTYKSYACMSDRQINCKIEVLDMLRQIQNSMMGLGHIVNQKLAEEKLVLTPLQYVSLLRTYVASSVGLGFMELQTAQALDDLKAKLSSGGVTADVFSTVIMDVEGNLLNSMKRIKITFGSYLEKYKKLVPNADHFIDETIRASTLLLVANLLEMAGEYTQGMTGMKIMLGTTEVPGNFRGLNPGIARGILKAPAGNEVNQEGFHWDSEAIYLLTETPATIHKVAGIISSQSGSMISHVQLLAANHGIANLHVSPSLSDTIAGKYKDKEVLIYVLPNKQATVKLWTEATELERRLWKQFNDIRQAQKVKIAFPPGLENQKTPMKLTDLRMKDAGIIAGGKACGQGELAAVFPGKVPEGIVLPFGVYLNHLKTTKDGTGRAYYDIIVSLLRDPSVKGNSPKAFTARQNAFTAIRGLIKNMIPDKALRDYLRAELNKAPLAGHGYFVRSDTNAEDIPGFVGAGLNQTIPNVVGFENVINAIKEVWASPFKEKAFTWREDLIENPWDILPSVIVQIAMPSDKAGVMIVGDPESDDVDDLIYMASNEGLGITTVDGQYASEEITYSRRTKTYTRLRKSYARTRKFLKPEGGFGEEPIKGYDPVVNQKNAADFAAIGETIQSHLARTQQSCTKITDPTGRQIGTQPVCRPLGRVKWDMEWAIINEEPVLLQIRRYNGNKALKAVALNQLARPVAQVTARTIRPNSAEVAMKK